MQVYFKATALFALLAFAALGPLIAPACTGITIKPKDGFYQLLLTLQQQRIYVVTNPKQERCAGPGIRTRGRLRSRTHACTSHSLLMMFGPTGGN